VSEAVPIDRQRPTTLPAPLDLFRLLVEGIRDYAIFVLDPEGHVITWNPGAQNMKGYRREEIIGQHFSKFYPPEAVESGWPARELALAEKEGRFADEGWRVRKDGSTFWASVIISPLRAADGSLSGFAKVTQDMTERRKGDERTVRVASATRSLSRRRRRELFREDEPRWPGMQLLIRVPVKLSRTTAGQMSNKIDRRARRSRR